MKSINYLPCLALAVCLLAGCAENQTQGTTAGATQKHSDEDDSDKPPFIGMTKAQATARYGDPRQQSVTEEGETWIYVRGLGAAMGKAMIPFYFGGRDIKTGALIFGPDGKVKKYRWDTKTDN